MVGPPSLGEIPREFRMPSDKNLSTRSSAESTQGEGNSVLVRLGWMVLGPIVLVVSLFTIVAAPRWTIGVTDIVLAVAVVLSIGLRFWDVHALDGQTANGEPATMAAFKRYAFGLCLTVASCWWAAQAVHI